jgi:hypothetical protein
MSLTIGQSLLGAVAIVLGPCLVPWAIGRISTCWVNPMRTHLEVELKQQREDFERQLADKNVQIRMLRGELAAAKAASTYLKPQVETIKLVETKAPVASQDWQADLNKLLQEEEDGIRNRGRIQEHEPSADDGA